MTSDLTSLVRIAVAVAEAETEYCEYGKLIYKFRDNFGHAKFCYGGGYN